MDEFNLLYHELKQYLTASQIALIEKAYWFAKSAHGKQTRYSGEPYITHPLTVASILAHIRMDASTIIAAILHDVVEDTSIGQPEIIAQFGQEVADLVDGVTKLTQIHFENYAEAQAENFYKMIMAMARDIRVIMIKLCDRLHNMRTLRSVPKTKRHRKAIETLEIFAPIAHRLGMHAIRVELEDLGFSALYPWRYHVLKQAVQHTHHHRQDITATIKEDINQALKQASIGIYQLENREKHLYSLYQKMRQKRLSFSDIMDVYGFRIIVSDRDECYRTLGALHNFYHYKPITQRFKDYIAIPKINGYQSLHTTLFGPDGMPIEVQIRTEAMHKVAENGIAAHWLYKSERAVSQHAQNRAKEWIKDIAEMGRSTKNPLEFIEHVKTDLFPDELYVFTPKGQIIDLPVGGTPVDFAYAVHSDIGNTCVAARLNKQLLPLSTALTSGQQVEIITAPGAKPNPAWLNFVVTGKARSNIKYYLKQQKRTELIALGKQLTDKALQQLSHRQLADFSIETLEIIVRELQLESIDLLFESVGMGHRPAILLAKYLLKTAHQSQENLPHPSTTSQSLVIKGTEGSVINYASCCRPIPGDHIAGVIKTEQGIEVHVALCPLLLADQVNQPINLTWEENITEDFLVDLKIDLIHQDKNLAVILLEVTENDARIIQLQAKTTDLHHLQIEITLTVHHRSHLAKILRKLHHRKEVAGVSRRK